MQQIKYLDPAFCFSFTSFASNTSFSFFFCMGTKWDEIWANKSLSIGYTVYWIDVEESSDHGKYCGWMDVYTMNSTDICEHYWNK